MALTMGWHSTFSLCLTSSLKQCSPSTAHPGPGLVLELLEGQKEGKRQAVESGGGRRQQGRLHQDYKLPPRTKFPTQRTHEDMGKSKSITLGPSLSLHWEFHVRLQQRSQKEVTHRSQFFNSLNGKILKTAQESISKGPGGSNHSGSL